ncbi:MAG: 4Fe-4S binding protein [Desulfobacterales bacterium]
MFNMTPNLIRNFLAERATRRHPFDVRPPFPGARGEIENSLETCIFCGVCAMKCPSQCLSVDKKAQTWEWNPFACVYCSICAESCPKQSLHQKTAYRKPVTEKATVCMKGEMDSSQESGIPAI